MATQGMNLQRRAYLSAEGGVLPCPLMNKVWVLGLVIFGLGNCGDAVVSAPAFGSSVPVTITMRHHTHAVAAGALICSAVCHHTYTRPHARTTHTSMHNRGQACAHARARKNACAPAHVRTCMHAHMPHWHIDCL